MLSLEHQLRYSRLTAIDEIGVEGLVKLRNSRVLVVGCGALGSLVAMQLAGSGIGHLRLVDFDRIDISNLQRQFFFTTSEAGSSKASTLASRIAGLNPDVDVEVAEEMLTSSNCADLMGGCDLIIEATDNPASMMFIDKECEKAHLPLVMAGVAEFSGQVLTCIPGGRRYSDIFPDVDDVGFIPCSTGGVAGPAAALAASVQASEAIKYLIGYGCTLSDKILVFNLLNMDFNVIHT